MIWTVIVNYRTAALVVECLRSIAAEAAALPGFRAVVVDNASGDGSVETLAGAIEREGWRGWASVIANDRNGGFASGNNVGIREALRARVDHVLLLNPDTVARSGAIRALSDFLDSHPQVGIAGSALENAAGGAECSAHNAPSPLGELESGASLGLLSRALRRHAVTPPLRDVAHECEWVSGASLMVKKEVFDSVGLLDEEYFLYFEEADFCLRARQAGWQVWFVPASRVVHLEGASTGIADTSRRRPRYWYDSRRRYFLKHFGAAGLVLADALWAVGTASLALRRFLRLGAGGNGRNPRRFALDLLWGDLRFLVTGK